MNPKGILIPIGGNEDKGFHGEESETYDLDYIAEGILSHVAIQCSMEQPKVLVIPTASRIPVEVSANYTEAFQKLGCTDVTCLDIRKRSEADKEEYLSLLRQANCVMFSGGDQSRISKIIGGTKFHQILQERYQQDENFVVAGTSAGAMAMSQEMIAGGSSTEALQKGAVKMRKGLGLCPEVIFDTHFIKRGRFGRVTEAIAKHPECIGIGLAEDTGMIIKEGRYCTVIGSGMVIIFDGSKFQHNNQRILEEGTPMSITNMVVNVLSNSDQYDLKTREVEILKIDAPFI